ncbi:MAG: hypothetical protein A2X17_00325 [Bacteroidetes bacterium GWF2_41_61]|nr:MAG: hypothetical protein A2X20_05700 [Bacteroidetes bacterium GWE2_40_15]OFY27969.1 MAG: hypothetical protein A2X17_00325 [Bacteroidetes bacterium GWF2_41_61]OFY90582.1 MAG: hypothetical protein A2266_10175 [Bacteroidetes bacterium RIFOXYA12_FULL_40_10]
MKFYNLIYAFVIVIIAYLLGSCANTTTPPMGGVKDTIPPLLIKVLPDSGSVNYPAKGGQIELRFNEYVVLKEPQKSIFLSPPLNKRVEAKIKGKSILITFPSQLDSGVTYTLNFGKSIVDNNEGNQFISYVYPFSTGSYLDSMMCSGTILNAATLLPKEDISVAFYKDFSDSVLYNKFPSAFSKSDKFGYFVVRNLDPGPYKIYAFNDINSNNKYDPENEEVAFLDSLFIPGVVLKKNRSELIHVDEKDTLAALGRPSEINLYLFREDPAKQFIKESKRLQAKMIYVKFSAPDADLFSVKLRGVDTTFLQKEFNQRRDSLLIWLMDTTKSYTDSLYLTIGYLKSDSLNNLSPFSEDFRLAAPKPAKVDNSETLERGKPTKERQKRSNLIDFEILAEPALFEQQGFIINFPAPIVKIEKDSIEVKFKTPKGETGNLSYSILKDSLFSRLLKVIPSGRILPGYEYSLKLKDNAFKDIYKFTNDSIVKTISLPSDDKLSKLVLDLSGVDGSYIVELTNITRDKVYRSYKITRDGKLNFPYLQPGKYSVKITQDLNGNGIIDTGNILNKRQPEKVRLFTLSNGSSIITIPESAELNQNINLQTIFN